MPIGVRPAQRYPASCNGVDTEALPSGGGCVSVWPGARSTTRALCDAAPSAACSRSRTRRRSRARSCRRSIAHRRPALRGCASSSSATGLAAEVLDVLARAGVARDLAWLPGARDDVAGRAARARCLRASLARRRHFEHDTGSDGDGAAGHRNPRRRQRRTDRGRTTGTWCRAGDVECARAGASSATRIAPELARLAGRAARARAERFMASTRWSRQYCALYDALLARSRSALRATRSPRRQARPRPGAH